GAGQIIVGFDVVQIKPWRDNLIVFGLNKIKYISPAETVFVIQGMTDELGCISSDSVVEANGDLLFMSQDGVRPISATERNEDFELSSISKAIQPIYVNLTGAIGLDTVSALTIRSKSQVRFFISQATIPEQSAEGI